MTPMSDRILRRGKVKVVQEHRVRFLADMGSHDS